MVNNLKKTVGLFVGVTTLDIQYRIDGFPSPNTKHYADEWGTFVGGPATNAATVFSHLGGTSKLYTGVGNNPFTARIAEDFHNSKIQWEDIFHQQSTTPPIASIFTNRHNGDRTIVTYLPDKTTVDPGLLNLEFLEKVQIFMADGFFLDVAIPLAQKAREKNIPVVFDGGSWKPGLENLIRLTDIAIVSERFSSPNSAANQDVIASLHDWGCTKVAVTRGEKPIIVSEGNGRFELAVEPIHAVDTLAAGDFFHGAFCYDYLKTNDFAASLKQAAHIAGLSCQSFGTRGWLQQLANLEKIRK
ncbi:MAG TPA: ribokinase [Alphaproteobacteria bacterium]|nr:ribokinase [Alphaproteobacteria bacterium]